MPLNFAIPSRQQFQLSLLDKMNRDVMLLVIATLFEHRKDWREQDMDREIRIVLLIDGSASILFYLGMLLKRLEYRVETARIAEDALRMMDGALPSIAITEISLYLYGGRIVHGAGHGHEICRDLRRRPGNDQRLHQGAAYQRYRAARGPREMPAMNYPGPGRCHEYESKA